MVKENGRGIVFYCNDNGLITDIVTDDLNVFSGKGIGPGRLFQNLIEGSSRVKAFEFILDIKKNNLAFDYHLNLKVHGEIRALYFMGILIDNRLLIAGANDLMEIMDFTDQLNLITNEQANLIRALAKNQNEIIVNQSDDKFYQEITKLNNELVNLQRELTLKNKELEKLNELKNRFIGMAAHDLRSPLNVIMNFSDFILDDASDALKADHKKFLGIILNSTQFMLALIEDLLDYSKIESGNVNLNIESVDIAFQIKNSAELNQVIAGRKNISIQFTPLLTPVMVRCDQHKTDQILNNLLSNAIKFSFPDSEIQVSLEKLADKAKISIRDSGIGIPKDKLSSIFIPFTRSGTQGTKGEKSNGLGLSIVKRIVEAQGGEISVNSEPGRGSEFIFTLPLLPSE